MLLLNELLSDIRGRGWVVAVHNDYRLGGTPMTFWLFTNGDRCVKGEASTDAGALNQVVSEIARLERKEASSD